MLNITKLNVVAECSEGLILAKIRFSVIHEQELQKVEAK